MLIPYKEMAKQQTRTWKIVDILLTEQEKWQRLIILSNLDSAGKFLLAKVILFLVLFRANWFFFLLLASLIIERIYRTMMGFYLTDNTQNIPETWSTLLKNQILLQLSKPYLCLLCTRITINSILLETALYLQVLSTVLASVRLQCFSLLGFSK